MNKIVPVVLITLAIVAVFSQLAPVAKGAAVLVLVVTAYFLWQRSRNRAG